MKGQSNKYVTIKGSSIKSFKASQNSQKNSLKNRPLNNSNIRRQKKNIITANDTYMSYDSPDVALKNRASKIHDDTSAKQYTIDFSLKKQATSPVLSKIKTQSQLTKQSPQRRFNTDYSIHSVSDIRFLQDHHNSESLAGLLQNSYKKEEGLQFNNDSIQIYTKQEELKKKKTIKGTIEEEYKNDSPSEQLRRYSSSQINLNQESSENNEEEQNSQIRQTKLSDYSKQKKKSHKVSSFSGYSYLETEQVKSKVNFSVKPIIRVFSHEDKLKMIEEAKYVPKTEQEIRMEQRYLSSQVKNINNIRQFEQMKRLVRDFDKSKKRVVHESLRKSESLKMINFLKNQSKHTVSLPKIKRNVIEPVTNAQIEASMSMQAFIKKSKPKNKILTQGSLKNYHECEKYREAQNTQYIVSMLKNKGVNINEDSLRKGLGMQTLPDYAPNQKIEIPKNLLSNPRYKQFPL